MEIDDWAANVSRVWEADWSDPREDIYTLEDGVPEEPDPLQATDQQPIDFARSGERPA